MEMIETWIPIIISFFALVISILALRISWITKNPIFHFEDIPPEDNLGVQRVIITNTGFGAGMVYAKCGISYRNWKQHGKMEYLKIPLIEYYNGFTGQNEYGSDSVRVLEKGIALQKIDAKEAASILFDASELRTETHKLSLSNVRYIRFYAYVTSAFSTKKAKVIFSKKIPTNKFQTMKSQ